MFDMKKMTFICLLVAGCVAVGVGASVGAQENPSADQSGIVNAQVYVKTLVNYMGAPDPRLRFSVREALRVMGPQAISAINEAKGGEKDKHVVAFMNRTVKLIKAARSAQSDRGNQRGMRGMRGGRGDRDIDIDRIAMEANLTWEQMDKTLPLLEKARKDRSALMQEFRDAGGNFRDPEARADLQEEMKTISEEAKSKASKFLSATQVKQLERHLNPFSRMGRMGMGGRRGGRGGERGGERGGRERP